MLGPRASSALAIAGVVAVGNVARDSHRPPGPLSVPVRQHRMPRPARAWTGPKFLGEVQYNGQFDDQITVVDPTLPDRLRAAFERHPRVQKVGKVQVLPPKHVVVELTFKP